jgi:hypothetical protein
VLLAGAHAFLIHASIAGKELRIGCGVGCGWGFWQAFYSFYIISFSRHVARGDRRFFRKEIPSLIGRNSIRSGLVSRSDFVSPWFLIAAISLIGLDVTVEPLQGPAVRGELLDISTDQLRVRTTSGEQSWTRGELLRWIPTAVGSASESPVSAGAEKGTELVVQLTDGSRLLARRYLSSAGRVEIEVGSGEAIRLTTRSIAWVRYQKPLPQLEETWQRILAGTRSTDVIVIRKTNMPAAGAVPETPTTVLDYLEGVLGDANEMSVNFTFDETKVDVPRSKIEGLVYRQPSTRVTSETLARVVVRDGSSWQVKAWQGKEASVELVSVAGVRTTVPREQIVEFDYSPGNLDYLSDLEPEATVWNPRQELSVTATVRRWFQPEFNKGRNGRPLQLNEQTYTKGLALHSYSEVRYRLTRPYRLLLATVGIDDPAGQEGQVVLRIVGDGKTVLERPVVQGEPPIDLQLDLQGIRRLALIVDFGDQSDRGDNLNLCNVRLVK